MSTSTTTPRRGALIAIEGLDRAGKSTQCSKLLSRLPNARLVKFPDRSSPTGQIINGFLTGTAPTDAHMIHLLFSANRWEAVESLRASLAAGETVVMDRYVYSGIAFSVAKGLDYAWCKAPDVGLPRPDAVVFLDLPAASAEGREGFGGERYEERGLQEKVRELFKKMREDEGSEDWTVVDARQSVDEVADKVWSVVEKAVEWAADNELRVFK
ncbi:thymidylate kinase-domain-containing protein [Geopyxis carbonaria]|nr:thymidylate kinase-domain-containing protein [Geopyxis carbonaria]